MRAGVASFYGSGPAAGTLTSQTITSPRQQAVEAASNRRVASFTRSFATVHEIETNTEMKTTSLAVRTALPCSVPSRVTSPIRVPRSGRASSAVGGRESPSHEQEGTHS